MPCMQKQQFCNKLAGEASYPRCQQIIYIPKDRDNCKGRICNKSQMILMDLKVIEKKEEPTQTIEEVNKKPNGKDEWGEEFEIPAFLRQGR